MTRKINNRNLVVTQTFDEFAEHTDEMDFSVEDLVAYVTSLSNVFYWLNVESVWGRLGFVWDSLDSATNRGYGHFVSTTIPFSILPSLPDGERITQFTSATFSSINSSKITLLRSNWENLTTINYIVPANKEYILDLTGAPLTGRQNLFNGSDSTLYIKGNFSNAQTVSTGSGYHCTIVIDDNNKGLGMPYSGVNGLSSHTIRWKGEGTYKDEYFLTEFKKGAVNYFYKTWMDTCPLFTDLSFYPIFVDYPSRTQDGLIADSNIYELHVGMYTDNNQNKYMSCAHLKYGDEVKDITLDCSTFEDGYCINYDALFGELGGPCKEIKYIGNFSGITAFHPYIYIEDSWPTFDANLFNKLHPNGWVIYKPYYKECMIACPYTIDCTHLNSLAISIPNDVTPVKTLPQTTVEERMRYDTLNNSFDVLPTFTNLHVFEELRFKFPNSVQFDGGSRAAYILIKNSLQAKKFTYHSQYFYMHLAEGAILTISQCARKSSGTATSYRIRAKNCATPFIHFKLFGDATYYYMDLPRVAVLEHNSIFNPVSFESLDDSILALSRVNTFNLWEDAYLQRGRDDVDSFVCPFIVTYGTITCSDQYTDDADDHITLDSSFFYISNKANITFTQANNPSRHIMWTYNNMHTVISSIRNDSEGGATMTLKQWIFEQLTQAEKDHIIQDLNYTLIEQI